MRFLYLVFIMLYTEDFSMRHYVGFSQIGSHIIAVFNLDTLYPHTCEQTASYSTLTSLVDIAMEQVLEYKVHHEQLLKK